MTITRRQCTALLAHLGFTQPGPAAPPHAGPLVWSPDTIAWQPDDPPGAKYAVLHGDRDDASSVFSYAFWLPGGVWAPVHRHSQTAHVAVMRGTLRLGLGHVADRATTVRISAGRSIRNSVKTRNGSIGCWLAMMSTPESPGAAGVKRSAVRVATAFSASPVTAPAPGTTDRSSDGDAAAATGRRVS